MTVSIFEDGAPPRFRVQRGDGGHLDPAAVTIETIRPGGERRTFGFVDKGEFVESADEIPEPHAFGARLSIDAEPHALAFVEPEHGDHARDNNMRSAITHVMADAMVSVLVIVGLLLARSLGWLWMDPLAGVIGALVIGSWSFGLIRDTGAILLDMNPDRGLTTQIRETVEASGDTLCDLHLWRLGPGHLGAIVSIAATGERDPADYRAKLARFPALSHITIEIQRARRAA